MFKEKYFELKEKKKDSIIIMKNGIFYVLEICFAKIKNQTNVQKNYLQI